MKPFRIMILLCLTGILVTAQEKAPIVSNDSLTIFAGDTAIVNVMVNDWGMEGHTIEIMNYWTGYGGFIEQIDSSMKYSSFYWFGGVDTIRYMLIDQDNGLFSEPGSLIVTVENNGREMLDVNNVQALIQSFGFQFCEIRDEYYPWFQVPAGSNRNSVFVFNLWLAGLNGNNNLHLAGETYRGSGMDFWNGPVSETYLNQQLIDYNNVWSLTLEDIENHRQNWWKPDYEIPESILNWPVYGNLELGQAEKLAAFNDVDENGQYDPQQGDYPAIRGDEGIFFMYNDDFGPHTESGGWQLKVEVHGQAYGYNCPGDSAFFNSIFLHYDVISRSGLPYHDFYIGMYTDFDIGYAWDDYLGCDTLLHAFYGYNGDDYDDDDTINSFVPVYGYREHPPAQGVVFLNHPMHSFIGYSNYSGVSGDPSGAEEMYNAMNGLWKDGTPITVGGNGTGGTETTRYLYPGDPSNPGEWSEFTAGNTPQDRRAIAATGPFDLEVGDTLQLDLAFVFARDYEGDHLNSVDLLKERIEQVRWYYENDSTPCGKTWSPVKPGQKERTQWTVYPNPASEYIRINADIQSVKAETYRICDLSGKIVLENKIKHVRETINTSRLSKGVYIIEICGGNDVIREKFIKK